MSLKDESSSLTKKIYDINKFTEQFPTLYGLNDDLLTPLIDVTFNSWVDTLPDENVTDMKKVEMVYTDYSNSTKIHYLLVLDGKINFVKPNMRNIYVDNSPYPPNVPKGVWMMASSLCFQEPKTTAGKLFSEFETFVSTQNLDGLMSQVRDILLPRVEMDGIYFPTGMGYFYSLK